jgi:hypothetical protein
MSEHLQEVNRRGAFPRVHRGGSSFTVEGAAPIKYVRDRLRDLGVRAGYTPSEAIELGRGHGPRHLAACFGARLMWSFEARAEFGMWNEGSHELYWDPRNQRVCTRVREVGLRAAQRYAQPAKQQVQMSLFAAMREAIVSVVKPGPYREMALRNEDLVHDCEYVQSSYYKLH